MNDKTQSPYQPPSSDVSGATDDNQVQAVKLLTSKGRIGRVRYIGYNVGFYLLIGIAGTLILKVLPASDSTIIKISVLVVLVFMFVATLLTIQRCHDMDKSGWWTVLIFIPLVNIFTGLYFSFWPGSKGTNRFGPRTPDNTKIGIFVACILPIIMIVGILAAIAIPAYSSYVTEAQNALVNE